MFLTKGKKSSCPKAAKVDNKTIKTCTSQMFDANDAQTEMSHAII